MKGTKKIIVVVLGDIGRSPRMQYHSLSLAKDGFDVDIVGYPGSDLHSEILHNKNIHIHYLTPLPDLHVPALIKYVLKTIWQSMTLFLLLLSRLGSNFVLCQNPPGVPTLLVCWIYCLIYKSKFVIDWHNYSHTILALNTTSRHPLVSLSKWLEMKIGTKADANLCVTKAMRHDLWKKFKIRASVLYDRPPDIFRPITLREKHDLFCRLAIEYPIFGCGGRESLNLLDENSKSKTAITEWINNELVLRNDRLGILFSSTSWTPDEDFHILLDALQDYETACKEGQMLPPLICVITGKGPLKEEYKSSIAMKEWQSVKFVMPWLTPEDYPLMVASADLGVCLHTSSSGLDLPMKVVDMFGTGLPVCAFDYPCLEELVKHGSNGYTFKNSRELSFQLVSWFKAYPHNKTQNEITNKFKHELSEYQNNRWQENWEINARKIFNI